MEPHEATPTGYPVQFSVEYPDRPLNRATTAFRLITEIPIMVIAATLGGEAWGATGHSAGHGAAVGAGGLSIPLVWAGEPGTSSTRVAHVPEYVYELRRGDVVIATGRLSDERALDIGDEIEIAGWAGIVRDAVPVTIGTEVRIVVEALPRDVQQ